MTQEEKELLNEKFKGIRVQMDAEFSVVHQSLKYIKDSVDLTNSRVNKLEANEIEHKLNCPQKDRIECIENDMLEVKMIKKYPRFFLLAGAIIGLGMIVIALSQMGVIG